MPFLTPRGTLGPLPYAGWIIAAFFAAMVLFLTFPYGGFLIILPLCWAFFCLLSRRMRDAGWSRVWAALPFILLFGTIFLWIWTGLLNWMSSGNSSSRAAFRAAHDGVETFMNENLLWAFLGCFVLAILVPRRA